MKNTKSSQEFNEEERKFSLDHAETMARIMRCEAAILRTCALDREASASGHEETAARLSGDAEALEAVSGRARNTQAAAREAMAALRALLTPLSEAVPVKDPFLKVAQRQIDLARRALKNPVRAVTRNLPGSLYVIRAWERRTQPAHVQPLPASAPCLR